MQHLSKNNKYLCAVLNNADIWVHPVIITTIIIIIIIIIITTTTSLYSYTNNYCDLEGKWTSEDS